MILNSTSAFTNIPRKIISLVPSQTELLHFLELDTETVGITKFCIYPAPWRDTKIIVGGTKQVNASLIDQIQPDLIIANKEENDRDQILALANKYPVWVTDVNNLDDALQMIRDIGQLSNRTKKAQLLVDEISTRFAKLEQNMLNLDPIPAAYLIWREPWMTVGGGTFIHDMMQRAGLLNVFRDQPRYPTINMEILKQSGCKSLLLSSEPYPFSSKHADALNIILPDIKMILTNGEMFSWYGSRLLLAPDYFISLIDRMRTSN